MMCTHSLPQEMQPNKGYMSIELFKEIIDEVDEEAISEISLAPEDQEEEGEVEEKQ